MSPPPARGGGADGAAAVGEGSEGSRGRKPTGRGRGLRARRGRGLQGDAWGGALVWRRGWLPGGGSCEVPGWPSPSWPPQPTASLPLFGAPPVGGPLSSPPVRSQHASPPSPNWRWGVGLEGCPSAYFRDPGAGDKRCSVPPRDEFGPGGEGITCTRPSVRPGPAPWTHSPPPLLLPTLKPRVPSQPGSSHQ